MSVGVTHPRLVILTRYRSPSSLSLPIKPSNSPQRPDTSYRSSTLPCWCYLSPHDCVDSFYNSSFILLTSLKPCSNPTQRQDKTKSIGYNTVQGKKKKDKKDAYVVFSVIVTHPRIAVLTCYLPLYPFHSLSGTVIHHNAQTLPIAPLVLPAGVTYPRIAVSTRV